MVSVIVPVYNVKPYLEECLDSILQQSYTQMEIILIDDGSTDGSGAICDSYLQKDNRFQVIHQQNQGLSAARNRGIECAAGDYLCFVDSDDYLYPNSIEILLRLCVENEADMSICTFDLLTNETKHCLQAAERISPSVEVFCGNQKMEAYLRQKKINTAAWGKMYAAKLFRELRFPVGKLYEDVYILHHILHAAERIAYLPKSIYVYRNRPGSITNSAFTLQSLDRLEASEQLFDFTVTHYPALLPYAQADMVYVHLSLLLSIFAANASYPDLEKQIRAYCKKHGAAYRTHGHSPKMKVCLAILCISLPLTKFAYYRYIKISARIRYIQQSLHDKLKSPSN